MMSRKQMKQLRQAGLTAKLSKSGHYRITAPDGHYVASHSSSESDWRSWRNLVSILRKQGFDIK